MAPHWGLDSNRMAERNEVTSKKANPSSFQSKLIKIDLHSGKLTSQWKVDPLKMYFLLEIILEMGIFQPAILVYQRVSFSYNQNQLKKESSKGTNFIIYTIWPNGIIFHQPRVSLKFSGSHFPSKTLPNWEIGRVTRYNTLWLHFPISRSCNILPI